MSGDAKYTVESITGIRPWTPKLFSFTTTRNAGYRFIPGQFARLGVRKEDGSIVWRPYSMVSASYHDALEFFSIVVPDGEFTSRLEQCAVGDHLLVDKTVFGFLTLDRLVGGRDLWLLSTGTGLAPFISMLYEPSTWENYENIVLVHSVRHAGELAYAGLIESLGEHELLREHAHKLRYLKAVTRERAARTLHGRITTLIESGELEREAGLAFDIEHSRVMICGNPDMVEDTRQLLLARGLTMTRNKKPGNIAVENYW